MTPLFPKKSITAIILNPRENSKKFAKVFAVVDIPNLSSYNFVESLKRRLYFEIFKTDLSDPGIFFFG